MWTRVPPLGGNGRPDAKADDAGEKFDALGAADDKAAAVPVVLEPIPMLMPPAPPLLLWAAEADDTADDDDAVGCCRAEVPGPEPPRPASWCEKASARTL